MNVDWSRALHELIVSSDSALEKFRCWDIKWESSRRDRVPALSPMTQNLERMTNTCADKGADFGRADGNWVFLKYISEMGFYG